MCRLRIDSLCEQNTLTRPQPWNCTTTVKFWVFSRSGRHLQTSDVIRTPSEQQLSRLAWTTNNSTNCIRWVSQCGNSRILPDGLKKQSALWNCVSGGVIKHEEQQNKLTHRHESHHRVHRKQCIYSLTAHVAVHWNTSSPPAASPFRLNRNAETHDGTANAVGDAQQCEMSSGALAPHPGSLVAPDKWGERRLSLDLGGETGLGRTPLHKSLARAGRNRAKRQPASLADTALADSSRRGRHYQQ